MLRVVATLRLNQRVGRGLSSAGFFGLDLDVVTGLGRNDSRSNPFDKAWYVCAADEREFHNGNFSALQILLIAEVLICGEENVKLAIDQGNQLAILNPCPTLILNSDNLKIG